AVRKALDAAIDKNAIVSTVLGGYGSVITGPLPPDAIGQKSQTSVTAETRVSQAKAILEKAGWKLGSDGIYQKSVTINKKKQTVRLGFSLATANTPELEKAAELTADDWKAIGADVKVEFFSQNDLTIDVIRPRSYDALLFGLVIGTESDLYPFWHSSQRNDPGLNIALYANANVDKILEATRSETDPTTRRDKA